MTKSRISIYFWSAFIAVLAVILFFQSAFAGKLIVPQYFNLGPVSIHYYGITMALAVLAAYWLAIKRSVQYNIEAKAADSLFFWVIIIGFIGARLYHVLSSVGYYSRHLLDIFKVWNGGLSIYGAILAGFGCVLFFAARYKLQPAKLFDWLAPSLILGQIIGRFGNFFNYELYGYPTNLPWKMYVPYQFRVRGYEQFSFFHPLFLYEVIGNVIIFFFLLTIGKKQFSGGLFLWYILLYNVLRFFLEFMRLGSTMAGGIRVNAVVSFAMFTIAAAVLFGKLYHAKVP